MTTGGQYQVQEFDLSGLHGISDETLEMHFKLYAGYVAQTNELNERIGEILRKGKMDVTAYSELVRRRAFEYNGMILHEHYFENLQKGAGTAARRQSVFFTKTEESFGSYAIWEMDFTTVAKMRGVGWAICYQDPDTGRLSNHWIDLHEVGNISGFKPVLVMDVWEHAYLLDYTPSQRSKYIEAFFSNINWDVVNGRID